MKGILYLRMHPHTHTQYIYIDLYNGKCSLIQPEAPTLEVDLGGL